MTLLRKLFIGIPAAALAAVALFSCSPGSREAALSDTDWVLVWEDNFDHGLDSTVWSEIPRRKYNWRRFMSPNDSCVDFVDGNQVHRGNVNSSPATDTASYLTGGIFTADKKAFYNGRLEIRAKVGSAQGAWPTIWMLPDSTFSTDGPAAIRFPNGGEVNIMEHINHDSIVYHSVHSFYTMELHQDSIPPRYTTRVVDCGEFNTYAIELGPDSLCFFINDQPTFTYPRIDTDLEGQYPFHRPLYLIIGMQLDGPWAGAVDPAELPVEMEVDWVRFYQRPEDI